MAALEVKLRHCMDAGASVGARASGVPPNVIGFEGGGMEQPRVEAELVWSAAKLVLCVVGVNSKNHSFFRASPRDLVY